MNDFPHDNTPGPDDGPDPFAFLLTDGEADDAEQAWRDSQRPTRKKPDSAAKPEPEPNGADLVTEDRVALRFAEIYKDHLRYDHTVASWYWWNGVAWRLEKTKVAFEFARKLARAEAGSRSWKAQLVAGKSSFAAGVERLAQSDRVFAVTSEIWDRDPWLLGTPGGTVDLRTGKLRPAEREDYITKLTAVAPAETPECPLWDKFLDEACRGDTGQIRFLRQWTGYSLTGSIQEHGLLFLHGGGGNGKGVWLNTVSHVFGNYCQTASMDLFETSKHDRHPTELAALKGARMVCASETQEGRAWSEKRIKILTGGDRIAARLMRQDFFEFTPEFKLAVIGNHKPVLRSVDDAIRRRFNLAPFTNKPPVVDKQLETKLRAEGPGILRSMIDGCIDWQMRGLVRPAVVVTATTEYLADQDTFAGWLRDCCEIGEKFKDTSANLFGSWREYAEDGAGSAKGFGTRLIELGFKRNHENNKRGFLGLQVLRPLAPSPKDQPPQDPTR